MERVNAKVGPVDLIQCEKCLGILLCGVRIVSLSPGCSPSLSTASHVVTQGSPPPPTPDACGVPPQEQRGPAGLSRATWIGGLDWGLGLSFRVWDLRGIVCSRFTPAITGLGDEHPPTLTQRPNRFRDSQVSDLVFP